jgi:hypothetical protein
MTHRRFSLTFAAALVLASFAYASAQSPSPVAPAAAGSEAQASDKAVEPQAPIAPIKGEGTAGRIPKFTDTYTIRNSIITESVKGLLGINNTNPSALLHIYGEPPAAVGGNGVTAPNLIHTAGGKGGATNGTQGWRGGRGASIVLTAGAGGSAPEGSTTGEGGSVFLTPGAAGGGGGTPGKAGNVLIAAGVGQVGVGVNPPTFFAKMHVYGGSFNTALFVESKDHTALYGSSTNAAGVFGYSENSAAISGSAGTSTAYAGHFNGRVRIVGSLTVTQNICAANFPCNSDARLKQGISNLNYGLGQLLRLRPVTWKWKAEPSGPLQLGLIAQEVEPVMPALVMREADATKPLGLNYMGLLPVIVKAVQEQQAEIEGRDARIVALQSQVEQLEREKKAEVEALRAENEAVKARLDALERAVTKAAAGEKP